LKKALATVLLLGSIALTGCAASEEPVKETTAGDIANERGTGIPKPDAQQEVVLLEALEKINPKLNNEKAIDNARNQCVSILDEVAPEKLISGTQARFEGKGVKSVSESEAEQILAAINTNGFCKR